MATVDEALDHAHRLWFGRLVGWLFRVTGDLQVAEDAVASAFVSAVTAWRADGTPHSPEAWLRVTARNHAISALRRAARTIPIDPVELDLEDDRPDGRPRLDDRLTLLLVCAHPAVDPRMHAPLMLQAVLGVDAARIASVFLVPAATMGQRLSRTKTKIRDAGIRYRTPEPDEFAERIGAVLQAIYGAYGLADPVAGDTDGRDADLRDEAIRLATLVSELLPTDPEALGLLALLLHTQSRRPARMVGGEFIPLAAQDTTLWSADLRRQADAALGRAATVGAIGRFQLEAAISAIHSSRTPDRPTDWESIVVLYRGLLRSFPSVGATIGAAAALLEVGEHTEAESLLNTIPAETVREHQPFWVCRARVERHLGRESSARAAAERAIGLTSNPALRRYLVSTLLVGEQEPLPGQPA